MTMLGMLVASIILAAAGTQDSTPKVPFPTYQELRFDFGRVGIDYTIYHDYPFENRTADTIRVLDINVTCDCSSVYARNTIVPPGDTTYFMLKFNTKDYYGQTHKTFTIKTDYPQFPELRYQYSAIVGQWNDGIKPVPMALFFLPQNKPQTLRIQNNKLDKISLAEFIQRDSTFVTSVLVDQARKGESLELEIKPHESLAGGSYVTNLTLHISKEDDSEPNILTIPIKIVVY